MSLLLFFWFILLNKTGFGPNCEKNYLGCPTSPPPPLSESSVWSLVDRFSGIVDKMSVTLSPAQELLPPTPRVSDVFMPPPPPLRALPPPRSSQVRPCPLSPSLTCSSVPSPSPPPVPSSRVPVPNSLAPHLLSCCCPAKRPHAYRFFSIHFCGFSAFFPLTRDLTRPGPMSPLQTPPSTPERVPDSLLLVHFFYFHFPFTGFFYSPPFAPSPPCSSPPTLWCQLPLIKNFVRFFPIPTPTSSVPFLEITFRPFVDIFCRYAFHGFCGLIFSNLRSVFNAVFIPGPDKRKQRNSCFGFFWGSPVVRDHARCSFFFPPTPLHWFLVTFLIFTRIES